MLMSKQLGVIVGILVALGIVGAVAFMQISKSPSQSPSSGTNIQEKSEATESASRGSIESLLKAGKSVKCDITYLDDSGNGVVYVADGKVRGDFNTKADEGTQTESHMIQDGEFGYIWSGNQGTKIKVDTTEASPTTGDQQQQNADLNKEVDLKCSAWSKDDSKFTLPTDVTFTDVSNLVPPQNQQQQTGNSTQNSGSYCDQITDPTAKAACLNALTSGN